MVDRRYGSGNLYGNERLYGASDVPIVSDRFQWAVDVDWTGTGYSGENEADTMTGFSSFRGRRSFLNPNGKGFAPIETGTSRITLDNSDGRYDAWNSSSPLYPNVQPGKNVRVRIRDLESGTTYPAFTGVLVDIQPVGYGADARAILVCEDGWHFLRNTNVLATFATESATVPGLWFTDGVREQYLLHQAIEAILGGAKWKYDADIVASTYLLNYFWASKGVLAGELLDNIAQSFFGQFYIDAEGTARFYDEIEKDNKSSVQTYSQSQMLKDIGNAQPWVNQRSSLRVRMHPRVEAANQVVWTLGEPVQCLAGQTVRITASMTYEGAPVPVITPKANPLVDYHMNTAADGSGTNLTNEFTVERIAYGDLCDLIITNTGSSNGWITDFDLVGVPVYESGVTDMSYPTVIEPGNRELIIESEYLQRFPPSRYFADTYGPQIAALRQFPIVAYDTRPESLVPDLFDVVTVSIAKLGVSSTEFFVGGIEIQTAHESCQSFLVRHYLEPRMTGS